MNTKKAVATVTSHLGGCANNTKVLAVILYFVGCVILEGIIFWVLWIIPRNGYDRWLLQDIFMYFLPFIWALGTAAIIRERK